MPRLQILQHKSYHPYLEKNKQRVREDEAKAKAEEEERERAQIDAESGARLDLLRRRAGSPSTDDAGDLPSTSSSMLGIGTGGEGLLERHRKDKARREKAEKKARDRLDFDFPSETARRDKKRQERKANEPSAGAGIGEGKEVVWESGGHLNLFADLEKREESLGAGPSLGDIAKQHGPGTPAKPDPFTMYLSRPDRETKPWYTDPELRRAEDKETGDEAEQRRSRDRRKDARSKSRHDPLTLITGELSKLPKSKSNHFNTASSSSGATGAGMSERQRAMAMLAAKRGTAIGFDQTPSEATWSDRFEREKARAGTRFYDPRP